MKKNIFLINWCLIIAYMVSFLTPCMAEENELTMDDFRTYGLNEMYDNGAVVGNENAYVISSAAVRKLYTMSSYEGVSLLGDVVIEFDYYEPSFAGFNNGMYVTSDSGTLMYIETGNGKIYTPDFSKNIDAIVEAGWYTFKIKFDSSAETFTVYGSEKGTELNELFTSSGTIDGFTKLVFQVEAGSVKDDAAYVDNVKAYTEMALYEAINEATSAELVEKTLDAYSDAGKVTLPLGYFKSYDNSEICEELYIGEFTSDAEILTVINEYFYLKNLSVEDFRTYGINNAYDDGATVGAEKAFAISAEAVRKLYTMTSDEEASLSSDAVIEFDYYEPSFAGFTNGMYILADSTTLMYIETGNGKIYTPDFSVGKDVISEQNWYTFKIKFDSSAETFTVYGSEKGGILRELFTYNGAINNFTKLVFQVEAGTVNDSAAYIDNVKAYKEKAMYEAINEATSADEVAGILSAYNYAEKIMLPYAYLKSEDNSEIHSTLCDRSFESDEAILDFIDEYFILNSITIKVSDKRYSVDYGNDIIYIDSSNVTAQELLQGLYTNADTIEVYIDEQKKYENKGFLSDGNIVVLSKSHSYRIFTVRLCKIHKINEDFENIASDTEVSVNNFQIYNNIGNNGSVSIAEENGDSKLKLYGKYVTGNARDIIIDTSGKGIYLPTVMSFDYSFSSNASISVMLTDVNVNRYEIVSQAGTKRNFFGGANQDGFSKKGRIAIRFEPSTGKISVYENGLLAENTYSDFDFSNFFVRFRFSIPNLEGEEAEAFLDNIKIYEDKSLDENYALEYPKIYHNSQELSSLQYGDSTIKMFIEPLVAAPEGVVSVLSVCNGERVKNVMCPQTVIGDNGTITCDYDLNLDYNADDFLNIYIWDENMSPLFKSSVYSSNKPYAPTAEEIVDMFKSERPRIVADNDDFAEIKRKIQTDSEFAAIYDEFLAKADRIAEYSSTDPQKYDTPEEEYYILYKKWDGVRILGMCGRVREFLLDLGLAYKIENDEKYAEKAAEIMEIVCSDDFPDWNPSHFLDVCAMTEAVAIGYDWFYDYLSDDQKELIRTAIITKGLSEGILAYEENQWWTTNESNWNVYCNMGLLLGAVSVFEDYTDNLAQLISKALKNIPISVQSAYPGGSWFEGPSYGLSVMHKLAFLTDTLNNSFGTDFSLTKTPGFEQFSNYILHVNGPCGVNNYSDCDEFTLDHEVLYWLGKTFDKPQLSFIQGNSTSIPSAHTVLWYSREGEQTYDMDAYFPDTELVTMRGAEDMSEGFWLSFCGGDSITTHSHLDCGAFVLDYNGSRFASDLGADDYNLTNYYYDAYRTRAEGHNTLVINPDSDGGQVSGFAPVIEKRLNCDNPYAIVDLTDVYDSEDAVSVKRGFMMKDGRNAIVIRDEIKLSKESEIYWFMHTKAENITISGNTAILKIGDDTLKLEFISDAKTAEISAVSVAPFSTSPVLDGQADNSGYEKIQIKFSGEGSVGLTVRITPIEYTPDISISALHSYKLEEWSDLK